jgi:hypothetical protein
VILLQLQLSYDLQVLEAFEGINESSVSTGQFPDDFILDVLSYQGFDLVP